MTDAGGLRLAVLDNVAAAIHQPLAAELFTGMMRARADGYGSLYGDTYLPFDRSDFIATHYLICTVERGELTPQGGYKEVSLARCDTYRVRLPILDYCVDEGARQHGLAVDSLLDEHRSGGRPLIYGANIVLRREARSVVGPDFFKELAAALAALRRETQGEYTEIITSTLRTGTDALFERIGFKPLQFAGNTLPAVPHPGSPQDQSLIMVMREPSEWASRCYRKHKGFLDDRLHVASDLPT